MPPAWTPTPAEVHAVIPQRVGGGAFSEATIPTKTQVEAVIADVVAEVVAEAGPFDSTVVVNPAAGIDDQVTVADLANRAATLGAASQIEDSFFPEQQTSVGPYGVEQDGGNQHLFARYRRALDLLRRHVTAAAGTNQPFSGSISTPLTSVLNHGRPLDTP